MKFPTPVPLSWIANFIGAELLGNAHGEAVGINEIHTVQKGDLAFVDHPKYYEKCLLSEATFIIINTREVAIPEGKSILVVSQPFEAYQKITKHFRPFQPSLENISQTATIGHGTLILPGVYIGHHVTIGENCVIHPNVVIYDHTIIGNDVVIQAGCTIGGDAFYYNAKTDREVKYQRMHSCGNVVIDDNVEIGCNCTIDRGVTASTKIGKGTIIDNLVHIAHDVQVGKNCLFAAQVGIAGATVIEDGVTLWGQVGVNKTITIGKDAVVLAQSGVSKTLEGGKAYWGYPAMDAREKFKEQAWLRRLPELWKKVFEP